MSAAVEAIRAELALANRILEREGVVDAFGHISARHPERPDRYLLSCSRSPALVEPGDIMAFALDGSVIGDDARRPYLERFIHGSVYAARADVQAVVHNHSPDLIPFGVTGTPIRPLCHVAGSIGARVPIWDIADRFGDSTDLLVANADHGDDLAATLGSANAALMRGHGAVVVGDSIRTATLLAVYLQRNARLDLAARQLGPVRYLSDGEIAASPAALTAPGPAARAWEYLADRVTHPPGPAEHD